MTRNCAHGSVRISIIIVRKAFFLFSLAALSNSDGMPLKKPIEQHALQIVSLDAPTSSARSAGKDSFKAEVGPS